MKPSERIEELARKRLDKEKEKGMMLFPRGIHEEAAIEAIIDFMDSEWSEKHQTHTNNGVSCFECREYGFINNKKI